VKQKCCSCCLVAEISSKENGLTHPGGKTITLIEQILLGG